MSLDATPSPLEPHGASERVTQEAPLRVAHVVATAGRSGVESYLRALLPSFDPTRVRTRLFVPGPGPLVDALAKEGITTELGAPSRKLAFAEARSLARRLRGECDVLHAHGPRAAFWGAIVAKHARIPRFVCTIHELRWRSLPPGPRRAMWVALESWALGRANRLIVLSRDSEARVRARFPAWASRLTLVAGSTPLLLKTVALQRADAGALEQPMRIVSIGRFEWVKRHHLLLEAMGVAVKRGANVMLELAGDGPLRMQLEAQVAALGLAARVRWPGATFDVPELLAGGHLFMSTSVTETFGIAALEAMAVGLPVITSDNGGVSELVEDGVTGRIVRSASESEEVKGLADALVELAADPALRAAWGQAGARRATERFSPGEMAIATTDLYRMMVAG